MPEPFPASRDALVVGYQDPGIMGQAPLLLAFLAGYYDEAGFEQGVTIIQVPDPLRDLRRGDLDIAVVPSTDAFAAFQDGTGTPAIAGYRNYAGRDGGYGGEVLLAANGLVENEPATVIAFLNAYIRALQDLSEPGSSAEALELLGTSQIAIDPDVAADWDAALAVFAPFDGGFGSLDDEGGLGELSGHLAGEEGDAPDLGDFIAAHTLNIAQAWQGLLPNPDAGLVGLPTITEITVGLPLSGSAPSPVVVAQEAGYFEAAGFDAVEIVDVEQPLMGLLQGELDFGVVDAVDAADGSSQGLPIVAIAGHQNAMADGTYGGDLLVTTADLMSVDTATATAFLIAYLQGLRDLSDSVNATGFAPFDGGFGERADGAGTGQLQAYLDGVRGEETDLATLLETDALRFAQAWWGAPANPVLGAPPTGTDDTTTDDAAGEASEPPAGEDA